jgi:ribosome-associated translation inhibitor RaiA
MVFRLQMANGDSDVRSKETRDTRVAARHKSAAPARAPAAARVGGRRTLPAKVPIYIYAGRTRVDAEEKDYLRDKLARRLGKFATAVHRVSVRLEDVNGPRGGVDQRCRIKVTLRGRPTAIVEAHQPSLRAAMDRAVAMAETAVRRAVPRGPSRPRTP